MWTTEQIKLSFTYNDVYPAGVACLIALAKLYNQPAPETLFNRFNHPEAMVTLAELKEIADILGFDAGIKILAIDDLKDIREPVILFFEDELGKKDFALYYGFDGKRLIIGEPGWGLMQYYPKEVSRMWIQGICLVVSPRSVL